VKHFIGCGVDLILVEAINTLRKAMVLAELAATTVAISERGDPASHNRGLSASTLPIAARTISAARQVSSRARSTFALWQSRGGTSGTDLRPVSVEVLYE